MDDNILFGSLSELSAAIDNMSDVAEVATTIARVIQRAKTHGLTKDDRENLVRRITICERRLNVLEHRIPPLN